MLTHLSALLLVAQGAVLQAAAHESLAYAKNLDGLQRSGCGALDHCRGNHHGWNYDPHHHGHHYGKHHDYNHGGSHGSWVPDPRTIFFPHAGNEYGRSWPLCKGNSFCDPKHAFGQVSFDFHHGSLVFELENKYGYYWKDVDVYIQANGPPNDRSYRAHCEVDHYRPSVVKCRAPYNELVTGCHRKDICPLKKEGSWIFYIQIKAKAVRHHEEVQVYSRGIKPDVCWFSLSYCCTECKYGGHPHRLPHRSIGEDYHQYQEEFHTEKAEEFHLPKQVEEFREKNRHEEGYDCDGALVAVYGRTKRCHPLKELCDGHHHKSCDNKPGSYNRIAKQELEVGVRGDLEVKGKRFGNFVVGLDKKGHDGKIIVSINVNEHEKVKVTEAAIFVKCDPNEDSFNGQDICKPETWPLTFANSKGLSTHTFNVINNFQCKGDYFVAVWVKACLEQDNKCNACHY